MRILKVYGWSHKDVQVHINELIKFKISLE